MVQAWLLLPLLLLLQQLPLLVRVP